METRKLNIVAHNITESKIAATADKKKDGEETLKDIVKETMKVDVEMNGFARLGKVKKKKEPVKSRDSDC